MNVTISETTALIIIDMQTGFDDPIWGKRNNPHAEENIRLLLELWRQKDQTVIHIQHCSLEDGSPLREGCNGNEFKAEARPIPNEVIMKKSVNSAFIGTELEAYLKNHDHQSLVIVGLTTDHCVSTSTRMAGNLGFSPILVSDATATFDRRGPDGVLYKVEEIHQVHLASLHKEFCEVRTTQSIITQICNQ